MSRFNRFYRASEDATVAEDTNLVIDPVEQEAIASGGETAADLMEVQERVAQIESAEELVEDTIDEVGTFEEQVANAEDSIEDNGMEQTAAVALDIAAESFGRKMGIARKKTSGMAIEAFGGASTRLRATKLAIEEGKGMIATAWQKLIDFIKGVGAWIAETFTKMLAFFGNIKARAEVIGNKASAKGAKTVPEVTKAGLAARVQIDGKVDADKTSSAIAAANLTALTLSQDFTKWVDDAVKMIDFENAQQSFEKLTEVKSKVDTFLKSSKTLPGDKYDAGKDTTVSQIGETLPGEFQAIVFTKKEGDTSSVRFKVTRNPSATNLKDEKIPGMDAITIIRVCDNIAKISANANKFQAGVKAASKTGDTIINRLKNITKTDEAASKLRKEVTELANLAGKPVVTYCQAALKSSSAVLDWANLSLNGKEEKKEKAKA